MGTVGAPLKQEDCSQSALETVDLPWVAQVSQKSKRIALCELFLCPELIVSPEGISAFLPGAAGPTNMSPGLVPAFQAFLPFQLLQVRSGAALPSLLPRVCPSVQSSPGCVCCSR